MAINKDASYGDCWCKGDSFLLMRVRASVFEGERQRLPLSPCAFPRLW